ncbi:MAG TPA: hypothetical protein VFH17_03135 [Coriobacteriia bacterium]|nr:hypothetical protein [Coriobacteriia bacterium]
MIAICETNVHIGQLRLMIAQADDSLAMTQQWLEQIHHLADRADEHDASVLVAQASVLIGEARAKLQASTEITGSAAGGAARVKRV